jgi:hypothetical protein
LHYPQLPLHRRSCLFLDEDSFILSERFERTSVVTAAVLVARFRKMMISMEFAPHGIAKSVTTREYLRRNCWIRRDRAIDALMQQRGQCQ